MGLKEGSWSEIRRPVMFMTGSNDGGGQAKYSPQWRLSAFQGCLAGDKYAVWIEGASHMTFACDAARAATGRLLSPRNPPKDRLEEEERFIDCIRVASTAFWGAYLKGDPRAKRTLQSDALKRYSDSIADVRRK